MSFQGIFDPTVETRPVITYPGSRNLALNTSVEESASVTTTDDVTLTWTNSNPLNGAMSTIARFNAAPSPENSMSEQNGHQVKLPCSVVIPAQSIYKVSAWVYYNGTRHSYTFPTGSVKTYGPQLSIGRGVSGGSAFTSPYTNLQNGWNKLEYIGGPHSTSITLTTLNLIRGSDIYIESGFTLPFPFGVVTITVDDWMVEINSGDTLVTLPGNGGTQPETTISIGGYRSEWEPANGDALYTANQYWYVLKAGTFRGIALPIGSLLYCVSGEYNTYLNASWESHARIVNLAQALQEPPIGIRGHLIGHGAGDWRVVVQLLLPSDALSVWGIGIWGEAVWNTLTWIDITDFVRGMQWTRGASSFNGRPEVGVAEITLDNTGRLMFSPWNGISSFRNTVPSEIVGDHKVLANSAGYFSPGTLVRIVTYSPSRHVNPITSP